MNLDLILENIRLGHIEALLQEATTDLEVVRGQRLINESIMRLRGVLMEEAVHANHPDLDKRTLDYGANTVFSPQEVRDNRNQLASSINDSRQERDNHVNSAGKVSKKIDDRVKYHSDRLNFRQADELADSKPDREGIPNPIFHLDNRDTMEHHYVKANIADNEARLKSLSGGTRTQPHEANPNSFTSYINQRGTDTYTSNKQNPYHHLFPQITRRDLTSQIQNKTLSAKPRTIVVASK